MSDEVFADVAKALEGTFEPLAVEGAATTATATLVREQSTLETIGIGAKSVHPDSQSKDKAEAPTTGEGPPSESDASVAGVGETLAAVANAEPAATEAENTELEKQLLVETPSVATEGGNAGGGDLAV
jgi:hypothetical protein